MVNNCANPKCAKPLHYLREGRIFVFEAESDSGKPIHRMEHFWLCGECSRTMRLEKTRQGVQTVLKTGLRVRRLMEEISQPLAS
jgi:hypothetical protein